MNLTLPLTFLIKPMSVWTPDIKRSSFATWVFPLLRSVTVRMQKCAGDSVQGKMKNGFTETTL